MNASYVAPIVVSGINEVLVLSAYRALHAVLRLFSAQLHGDVLMQLVQRALVDLAVADIHAQKQDALMHKKGKNKVTLTEIGLRTGIDTRVVRRLQEEPLCIKPEDVYPEAAILSRWHKDPALFNGISQGPKDLVIYGRGGTFQGLVLSVVGRGISATAVLDRLVSCGHVKVVRNHYVRLLNPHWCGVEEAEIQQLGMASQRLCRFAAHLGANPPSTGGERRSNKRLSGRMMAPKPDTESVPATQRVPTAQAKQVTSVGLNSWAEVLKRR